MNISNGVGSRAVGRVVGMLPLAGIARRAVVQVLRWQELGAQRRALRKLDDHMIKDLGLDRSDIEREVKRPFWDDPLECGAGPTPCSNDARLRA